MGFLGRDPEGSVDEHAVEKMKGWMFAADLDLDG